MRAVVPPDQPLPVFVYGTLQPGERNFERYGAGRVTSAVEAKVRGRLYLLPMGYPGLTAGDAWVHGVRLTFADPAALAELDELEGYDPARSPEENEYERTAIETFALDGQPLGPAWVYRMTERQVRRLGGVLLPKGSWTRNGQSQR